MGSTYTIEVWASNGGGYVYVEFYAGENFIVSLWNMFKAKRQGYGCVMFSWRG